MVEREERGQRDRDRDDRDRKRERCRPWYGDIGERLESLRRGELEDAVEFLRTIIDAAFYQGIACCCMECKCEHEEDERGRSSRRRELD